MSATRIQRQLATWLAVLAILASSFAPLISQALTLSGGTPWAEVCSSQTLPVLQSNEVDSGPAKTAPTHLFEHCPYCSSHSPSLALAPLPLVMALPLFLGDVLPQAFYHAPRPLFAWLSAQPRAPPSQP